MRAVGNDPNRAHNYIQDFWKCLAIFNKAQQIWKYRKMELNGKERERKATCHLPGWAGPPGPCQSSPTSASRQRRETAHARPWRHTTPCSPASLRPPRRIGPSLRRRPEPLDVSLSPSALSLALSSPWLQPPSARRRETAATVLPSPLRPIHRLRLHRPRLSVSSHDVGRPASPSAPPSLPPLPRDHRQPHDLISPSPGSPRPPSTPP